MNNVIFASVYAYPLVRYASKTGAHCEKSEANTYRSVYVVYYVSNTIKSCLTNFCMEAIFIITHVLLYIWVVGLLT